MIFFKKLPTIFLLAVLATVFLVWHSTRAASAPQNQGEPASDCAVTQDDVATIKTIQGDPTLSYASKMAQELIVRKTLLAKTITCAKGEIGTLRDTLHVVSSTESGSVSIQAQLMSRLDDASNYYDLESDKLADAGIMGTEQVAKEILSWRGNVLAPLGNQIDSFVMWSENQPLFTAATARMAQVSRIVSFLAATNDNDLASAFSKAQATFHAAQDQNAATEKAITQSLSGDEVSALMRQSLQSLADTYQNFFSISTIIQGAVSSPGQK